MVRQSLNELGLFDDIVWDGVANAIKAAVGAGILGMKIVSRHSLSLSHELYPAQSPEAKPPL